MAFDRDSEAVTDALSKFRVLTLDSQLITQNFSCIRRLLSEFRNEIDGIYFDLGLSSRKSIMLREVLVLKNQDS